MKLEQLIISVLYSFNRENENEEKLFFLGQALFCELYGHKLLGELNLGGKVVIDAMTMYDDCFENCQRAVLTVLQISDLPAEVVEIIARFAYESRDDYKLWRQQKNESEGWWGMVTRWI
jgi:hypothetical protein